MLESWETEKAKALQDELGATDDEIARIAGGSGLGTSTLSKSLLGASTSTRRVGDIPRVKETKLTFSVPDGFQQDYRF